MNDAQPRLISNPRATSIKIPIKSSVKIGRRLYIQLPGDFACMLELMHPNAVSPSVGWIVKSEKQQTDK